VGETRRERHGDEQTGSERHQACADAVALLPARRFRARWR
jgi:hypothetical protein